MYINHQYSFGNNAKTIFGWFKTTNSATYQTLAGFFSGSGAGDASSTDWIVQISGGQLYFVFGLQQAAANVSMGDTNWHLFVAWFDKNGGTINIDLDHGAVVASVAAPATPQTVANNFILGGDATNDGSAHQFLGILDAWGIAIGVPSQADKDFLWNSGNGWDGPSVGSSSRVLLTGVGK